MSKAEKFISDYTRNCSNELCAVEDRNGKKVISYHEWLTPEQALRAVEIAKQEVKQQLTKDAVEVEDMCVLPHDENYSVVRAFVKDLRLLPGDKVKVLIIKE